ncbi:MAG: DUF4430 domain-containing protein [Erysipelotrichaceae bacterium]|nr:DUF4430 domain-containing protein [Erysipelotrichaceae bacterium]
MTKKILICLCLILSLCACTSSSVETATTDESEVVETTEDSQSDEEETTEENDEDSTETDDNESGASSETTTKSNNSKSSTSNSSSTSSQSSNSNSNKTSSNNTSSNNQSNTSTSSDNTTEDSTIYCTYTIDCSSILSHTDALESNYQVPSNGIIYSQTMEIEDGDTVMSLLKRTGVSTDISLGYVKGIDGLYEFDCGSESGWTYSVNGVKPNVGASKYSVSDGDVIKWIYVVSRSEW